MDRGPAGIGLWRQCAPVQPDNRRRQARHRESFFRNFLDRPDGAPPPAKPRESEDCLFLNVWTSGFERRPSSTCHAVVTWWVLLSWGPDRLTIACTWRSVATS